MVKHPFNLYFFITLGCILTVGFTVVGYGNSLAQSLDTNNDPIPTIQQMTPEKPKKIIVKGLYLTASSAQNAKKRQSIIDLIKATELNAVVIDIKDYTGHLLYKSDIPLVNELHTDRPVMKDVRAIIADFKKNGIYVIARQTVFQDPALASAKPEWAIKTAGGSLWRDYKGLSWVDPTREEVWHYNMAIAREAALMGFDEMNFDYVRFPSDGPIRAAVYANLKVSKANTMAGFYQYLHTKLRRLPVYTSLDLFGLVLESGDFDMNIGQKLSISLNTVDYISPMTYPSHYSPGHLNMHNPADHPYEVIHYGLTKAEPVVQGTTTRLRPWLQAFNLGAVYDGQKIRAEITAVEESSVTSGWLLWNASNNYTDKGLKASSTDS